MKIHILIYETEVNVTSRTNEKKDNRKVTVKFKPVRV